VLWESGATPVVILNKSDLSSDSGSAIDEVTAAAGGADVVATSAATGQGIEAVSRQIGVGKTAVFVGSSGVGKSSLVNRLMNSEVQHVSHIRSDDKGRHTTTSRQLMVLPSGGIVIDTPGLRELQLWDAEGGIGMAFRDVQEFSGKCAFSDCRHSGEPGCAVQAAIDDGSLDEDRLRSYRKLEREQLFIDGKKDYFIRNAEKRKWKQIHKEARKRSRL
jgi:ribosome biogenesis GTPase